VTKKNSKDKKTFPKIATKTKIQNYKKIKGGIEVKPKLTFSPGQHVQIDEWIENGDELLVTIEQYQSKMDSSLANKKKGTDEIPFEEDSKKN